MGQPKHNNAIADVFDEMADLLRIGRGDPHRARAFRRVATVLRMLPEPAERLLSLGRLHKVSGIGEGAVHRIKQILRTGSCDDHRALRAALPPSMRDLLGIRGLGPSKVQLLYQHLGISSIDELELAARSGRLAGVPQMGERSAEQLLQAIEEYRRQTARLPLAQALAVGEGVLEALRQSPAVLQADLVGSGRRRCETVGDVDFIAASDDPQAAVALFRTLDPVVEVISQGEAQCYGRLASGHQIDLWVFTPREYGAGLHAFSGCQAHVVGIRERANRRGLHISEHGVFRRSDGQKVGSAEREEQVFAAVGLPFIVPELREACGEIDAAERGRLPRLLETHDLLGDLHMHSTESDGTGSARVMAEAAANMGLQYLAITDHSKSLTVARGLDESRLQAQVRHLRQLQQRLPQIRILAGIEVDILADGELDLDLDILRDLDWVVASVHIRMEQDSDQMTARLIRAMETGVVDCIGHPTGRRLGLRDGYPLDLERVLRAAADLGVAVEVNGNPGRLDLDSVSCRRARELGALVAVNSDAHGPEELSNRRLAVYVARRGWLEPQHVVNAQPVETLVQRRVDRMRRRGLVVVNPGEPLGRGSSSMPSRAAGEHPDTTAGNDEVLSAETDQPEVERLRQLLSDVPADPGLRERLETYLQGGHDPLLSRALEALTDNPLQMAFNLVVAAQIDAVVGDPSDEGQ